MSSREKFEAWFENDVVDKKVTFPAFEDGEYTEGDLYDDQLYFMLQAMWMAWQAASKASEQQLAAVVAENAGLTSGFSFFMHSPDAGFETYKTRDEAINAANEMIDEYRGDAGDGWPEEVEQTVWGVIIQHAVQCDIKKPSEENRWEGSCDYKLLPETPATDRIYAEAEARGVEKLIEHLVNNGYDSVANGVKAYMQLREGVDK